MVFQRKLLVESQQALGAMFESIFSNLTPNDCKRTDKLLSLNNDGVRKNLNMNKKTEVNEELNDENGMKGVMGNFQENAFNQAFYIYTCIIISYFSFKV